MYDNKGYKSSRRKIKCSNKKVQGTTNSVTKRIINIVIIMLIVMVCVYTAYSWYQSYSNQKLYEEAMAITIDTDTGEEITLDQFTESVANLQLINEDIKAWIHIPNTEVNYPIVQHSDNDYYLHRNYNKEYTKYGSIYMNYKSDFTDSFSNIIVYGHNMKDGQMFATLNKYASEDFFNEHNIFYIVTSSEVFIYEIFGVFNSKVYKENETGVFRYYQYHDLENENEYQEYVENIYSEQLYDTGRVPEYGKQIMTLSTCRPGANNNRIVVVAQRK